ncbi:MAG: hypothetical protein J7K68_00060 [Candidatus Diapherotrites archaeon]|nr:hypothetical protein [Candidatus Diapherotrites archaeon]
MVIVDLETKRQAVHLVSGIIFALAVFYLPSDMAFYFLTAGAILTVIFAEQIEQGKNIIFFSKLVKHTERKGKPPASGVTWYFLGVLFIMVLYHLWLGLPKIFIVASMLVVAIGDSICTGLGRKIGRKKLPRTQTKSYRGSGIGFGLAFVGALIALNTYFDFKTSFVIAAIGSVVGMLTEAYLRGLDDNLTIPIMSCSAMVITYLLI